MGAYQTGSKNQDRVQPGDKYQPVFNSKIYSDDNATIQFLLVVQHPWHWRPAYTSTICRVDYIDIPPILHDYNDDGTQVVRAEFHGKPFRQEFVKSFHKIWMMTE